MINPDQVEEVVAIADRDKRAFFSGDEKAWQINRSRRFSSRSMSRRAASLSGV